MKQPTTTPVTESYVDEFAQLSTEPPTVAGDTVALADALEHLAAIAAAERTLRELHADFMAALEGEYMACFESAGVLHDCFEMAERMLTPAEAVLYRTGRQAGFEAFERNIDDLARLAGRYHEWLVT